MNEDVLCIVAGFSDKPTLAAICRASRAMHPVAARLLYRSVFVRCLDQLCSVHATLARNPWLGPFILELLYDSERDVLLPSDDPGFNKCAKLFVKRLIRLVFAVLPQLTGLETLAIDCIGALGANCAALTKLLGTLPRLRNVRLPGLGSSNLRKLRTQQPLEHLAVHERPQTGLEDLIVAHAATLRSLRVHDCGALFKRLAYARNGKVVFPRLYTLSITKETFPLSASHATMFPAVRSLSVSRPIRDVCAHWTRLEHLDYYLGEVTPSDGLLPQGYAIRSLRLTYIGGDIRAFARFKAWASPHVCALALCWPCGGFAVHAAALDAFSGLRTLDIMLLGDESETDTASWLHNAAALAAVPLRWEVLTLRGATGFEYLSEDFLDANRGWVPSLRLLRIHSPGYSHWQWRVFARDHRPVDWLAACEIVADYLSYWRDTRAPWDDIRNI